MARPVQEVRDELARVGCEAEERHVRELASLLVDRESIRFALYGQDQRHGGEPWTLAVVTGSRAIQISIDTSGTFRGDVRAAGVYWVDAAQVLPSVFGNGVRVETLQQGGSGVHFTYTKIRFLGGPAPTVPPERVAKFLQIAQSLVAASKEAKSSGPTMRALAQAPTRSLIDELERLGNLKTRGLLTDAEFEAAKRKLLS